MSTTAKRRKREFQQREAMILKAAHDMFKEVGFLNLKMADLAREVEYSTGTLYQHFTCKEDLLLAMSAQINRTVLPLVNRSCSEFTATRDRITAFCLCHAEFTRRNPETFRIWQLALARSVWLRASENRREELDEIDTRGRASLQAIVDDAVAAGDLEPHRGSVSEIGLSLFSFLIGTYTVTSEAKPTTLFDNIDDAYDLLRRNVMFYLDNVGWKPIGADVDEVYRRVSTQLDNAKNLEADNA